MDEGLIRKIEGGVWSPVFTLPRNEKKVFTRLKQRGVPAYLPLRKHVNIQSVISGGKSYSYKRELHVPMFTNYLFVNVTPEVLSDLNWDRSVVRVLKTSEQQESALIEELKIIRELESVSEDEEIDVTFGLKKGKRVVFTEGFFKGWSGVILSVEPTGMVYINITSVEASVEVKYPAAWCLVSDDPVQEPDPQTMSK